MNKLTPLMDLNDSAIGGHISVALMIGVDDAVSDQFTFALMLRGHNSSVLYLPASRAIRNVMGLYTGLIVLCELRWLTFHRDLFEPHRLLL